MKDFDKRLEFNKVALLLNSAFTFVHICLLASFFFLHIKFMAVFNIFSVLMYLFCYLIIHRRYIRTFMIMVISEVTIHLICATVCCGWGSGFPLYSFALTSVIFYTRYIYNNSHNMKRIPWVVSFISMITFIALRAYTFYNECLYPLPERARHIFYIANSVLVFTLIFVSLYNYTRNAISNEKNLQEKADRDELTRLYNRHKMYHILEVMDINQSTKSCAYSAAMLDIDDFKLVNDRYGHEAGDYVLKTISKIMRKICRDNGNAIPCRWGGEEFVIVQEFNLMHAKDIAVVSPVVRIVKAILEEVRHTDFDYNGTRLKITMTAGVAHHHVEENWEDTVRAADSYLYWGKVHGKDQLVTQPDAN